MSLAIANRYARALADSVMSATSGLDPQAALAQLREFSSALAASPDLKNVLMSPAVANARKRAVVAKLGEPLGLHRLIRNFLFVAIDHRRVGEIGEMITAFQAAIDERLGRVRAVVTSAEALSGGDGEALQRELEQLTGKQVRCEFQVDPALVGGVSVRIGSTIYDGSVRGQLNALRGRLGTGNI